MSAAKSIIYALCCPRCGAVRYVGKSSRGLARARQHARISEERDANGKWRYDAHVNKWIRSLTRSGQAYGVLVLEETTKQRLSAAEQHWIRTLRLVDVPLTNATDGGDGTLGRTASEETRRRLSEGISRAAQRQEVKARMSAAQKARYANPSELAKLDAQQKAYWARPDARNRAKEIISEVLTPEARTRQARSLRAHYASMTREQRIEHSRKRGGRAFVDQNGTRYEIVADAAKAIGCTSGEISAVLRRRRARTHGMAFTYVE